MGKSLFALVPLTSLTLLFLLRPFTCNTPLTMSDDAVATPTQVPAKAGPKKKASKPKKPADHPKYSKMIQEAISSLKERGGSSRQAVLKHIIANFNIGKDVKVINGHLKMALKAGVKNGTLKQSKGTGASGSFRLGDKAEKAAKPKTKPKAASPKKPKSPAKKPKAKKAAPKKKSPKKAAKSPAKAAKAAKSPAKAAKPKAKKAKSPAKKEKKAAKK